MSEEYSGRDLRNGMLIAFDLLPGKLMEGQLESLPGSLRAAFRTLDRIRGMPSNWSGIVAAARQEIDPDLARIAQAAGDPSYERIKREAAIYVATLEGLASTVGLKYRWGPFVLHKAASMLVRGTSAGTIAIRTPSSKR